MAYADDLIVFAREMAELYPSDAHQPSLRRAVSTAYYALFHLLISDAVAQCPDPQFRAALARVFEHGLMKSAFDTRSRKSIASSILNRCRSLNARVNFICIMSPRRFPRLSIIDWTRTTT
jgi:hypothetical protein